MSTISALLSAARAKSGPSTSAKDVEPNSSSESDHDIEQLEPPTKKKCTESEKGEKHCSKTSRRKYSKTWEKEFSWLMYDDDSEGASCRTCKESGKSLQRTGGVWVTKPFQNWKRAVEKMRAHERSESHIRASEALLLAAKSGTIAQQLQSTGELERAKYRAAVKSLIRCTHFLTRQHIAHSTNFTQLVDLVVSCGAQDMQIFVENAAKNAVYTSRTAVGDFIEALDTWSEEHVLNNFRKHLSSV